MYLAKLVIPVYTLDRQLLLPADTSLTWQVMTEVAARGRSVKRPESVSFFEYGPIKQDFLEAVSQPPYLTIFAPEERLAAVLAVMAETRLLLPLLDTLAYFRQRDFATYRHMLMIYGLSMLLAGELIPEEQRRLRRVVASPTHDIGKLAVPMDILLKRDILTRNERMIVQQHTLAGYVLLSYYQGSCEGLGARVARDHHEHRNGCGYPKGIRQTDPMVEIITVCDVYDALIAPRPYRPVAYDNRSALEVITSMAENKEICWEVARAMIAVNRQARRQGQDVTVSREKRGVEPPGNLFGHLASEGDAKPEKETGLK